jgi:hypothetical protein
MRSTIKGLVVVLCVIGLFAGTSISAQERSRHVLHDAATRIKAARITVPAAPDAVSISKTRLLLSAGTQNAAEAVLRLAIDRGEEAFFDEPSPVNRCGPPVWFDNAIEIGRASFPLTNTQARPTENAASHGPLQYQDLASGFPFSELAQV